MTRPLPALLVALLLSSACAQVGTGATDLSEQAGTVAERTQFCLSLARTLSAIDADANLGTALQAAEETLTRAPDEFKDAGRALVDHLRRAEEGEVEALDAPAFGSAVEDLREGGLVGCDPTE